MTPERREIAKRFEALTGLRSGEAAASLYVRRPDWFDALLASDPEEARHLHEELVALGVDVLPLEYSGRTTISRPRKLRSRKLGQRRPRGPANS